MAPMTIPDGNSEKLGGIGTGSNGGLFYGFMGFLRVFSGFSGFLQFFWNRVGVGVGFGCKDGRMDGIYNGDSWIL